MTIVEVVTMIATITIHTMIPSMTIMDRTDSNINNITVIEWRIKLSVIGWHDHCQTSKKKEIEVKKSLESDSPRPEAVAFHPIHG